MDPRVKPEGDERDMEEVDERGKDEGNAQDYFLPVIPV